jgi:alpha-mannosidase
VRFRTSLVNRARDHRLRTLFAVPHPTDEVRAEGQFMIVRRPLAPRWSGSGWRETPALTHHMGGIVAVGDLAVLTRGLPEYQAVGRGDGGVDLAVTLLRCVDAISRGDLEVRPGHVGPAYVTPGAQGLGAHTFEYAIAFGVDHESDLQMLWRSQEYRFDTLVAPGQLDPIGVALPELDGVILSALKPSEDGDGLILRVFAPTDGPGGVIRPRSGSVEVTPCRLDETALPPAQGAPSPGDRQAGGEVPVAPGSIVTVRLRPWQEVARP